VQSFPITAAPATRPHVAFALSKEHWAVTVQVPAGASPQQIVIGGKVMQTVPIAGISTANPGKLGGIEALIVDGDLHDIEGSGAGFDVGLFSTANHYDIEFAGSALVARWPVEGKGWKSTHHARLALDGHITPETGVDEALRSSFHDEISIVYESGADRTVLTRITQLGAHVGNPTRIDTDLPDVRGTLIPMDIAWAGDHFVIAHEATPGTSRVLRTVTLRCDGAAPPAAAPSHP
jgi:hypothetical protein